jgi:hypothetical protein
LALQNNEGAIMSLARTVLVLACVATLPVAAQQGGEFRWPGFSTSYPGLSAPRSQAPGLKLNLVAQAGSSAGPVATYGVGVSWVFTPSLSASVDVGTYDLRAGTERDTVRFTNLGLQWRY